MGSSMNQEHIINEFKEIGKNDTSSSGGKGASLGEMTQAGIPVPPGFVIVAAAFERFLREAEIHNQIDAILHKVDRRAMHTVEQASEEIKVLIMGAKMPKDIAQEILAAHKKLNAQFVAVRSSATAEDSSAAAWAGQLESYLNTTKENLLENVKRCWASLFTPRAIFYRFEQNLHEQHITVAVVVQKMVASEKSGIAFSVHPITQDKNQLIIEAGFGLGEAIVSGQITPDSYVVEKQPRRIIDKNVQIQSRGLYCAEKGGNEWRDIPKEQGEKQVLADEEILELSEIVLRIENHYGFPCDVEWAFENGKFYILQSRPITTLGDRSVFASYEYYISRDFSVPMLQLWYRSEALEKLPYATETQPHKPYIVLERTDGTVKSFYDTKGKLWTDEQIVRAAQNDPSFLKILQQKIQNGLKKIQPIYENPKALSKPELMDFFENFERVAPWAVAMWWLCGMNEEELRGLDITNIRALRERTDKLSSGTDIVIRLSLKKIYPQFGEFAPMLTIEEIKASKLPSLDELKKRDAGFILTDDRLFVATNRMEIENQYRIRLPQEVIEGVVSEIRGAIAYQGLVRGRVRRMMGHREISQVQIGEVIISPMTMPDFLPAMQKAAAFVTDEGGITCHVAIVAREMKKPCIIGTKFATQVLKNGDLVEVDAYNGVVRILESKNDPENQLQPITTLTDKTETVKYLKKQDYILSFWVQGVSVFVTDIHLEVYKALEVLYIIDRGMFKQYFTKRAYEQALDRGLAFYSDKHAFDNYQKDLSSHCDRFKEFFESEIKNKEFITQEMIIKFFEYTKKLCGDYTKMNFEFTDKAFAHQEENSIIKKNLSGIAKFKDSVRSFMNMALFEANGYLNQFFTILGKQFNLSPSLFDNLTQREILDLFEGKKPIEPIASKRQNAFVESYNIDGFYEGRDAEIIIREFKEEATYSEIIRGQIASTGKIIGNVKIIPVDYSDLSRVNAEIEKMKQGDILVAETTAPELIVACKKAGAIVTDMGGLMSHAAIVSREFGIPCIVGTKNASKILRDGDRVEVDATKGTVKVLSKITRK